MLIAKNAASTVSRSLIRARLPLRAAASVRLGNACLVYRSASSAAAANVEAEETPLWEDYASKPDTTSSATNSELPVEDPAATPSPHLPFSALQRRVNHDSLKALTKRPFNFEYMSEVQEQVLSLMPDLVGFAERPPHGVTKAEWEAQKPEEERNLPPPHKKDLLVKAKTGTGKTVAFLVPAIERRLHFLEEEAEKTAMEKFGDTAGGKEGLARRELSKNTIGALIISPTRELATQIANEAIKCLTWHKLMEVRLLVGGENRRAQIGSFKRGRLDVVVATPGRLKDLMQDDQFGPEIRAAMSRTGTLILDEADTLLDMGFTDDLNYIVDHTPKDRQTFLFSATVSSSIKKIARKFLDKEHLIIDCVPENESNVHEHIPQYYTVLPSAKEQLPHVLKLLAADQLRNAGSSKSIVFLPTTKLTQLYATFVRELSEALPAGRETNVYEIHSKLEQRRRSKASDAFRQDSTGASVLVTSDVSARGVDYPGVTRVIQVGIPSTAEQYIHRVGRTGRGGSVNGQGDLVLLPWEAKFINALAEVPIQEVSTEETTSQLEQLAKIRDEALGTGDSVLSAVKKVVRRTDRFGTRGRSSDASTEPYLPRYHKMDDLINDLKVGLDPEAVEEVFVSMLGYYAAKADTLLKTPSKNLVASLQSWAVEAGGMESAPYVSASFLQKLGIRSDSGKSRGGNSFGRSGGGGFNRGDRDGGFNRGDRDGGFNRDRSSGGFSRDRDSGFGGNREGGFRSGGDRSFGRSSGPKFEPKKRGGFGVKDRS
ncbi:hypothetical protein QFC21_003678 [Naganishia friedmannii]|uniref:Uncharacterized protein n=1 Tax=Naganishia friedmannii TaxID=89922 RepID=A0ACC2VNR6_9TREE|nr:hypothetical protein QFC21_003678 [Naganishia friedmannii]